jgi:hypothetical protein
MADDNAPLSQKQFDVTQAEAEHVIQPHGMANDCGRDAVAVVRVEWRLHAPSLVHTSTTAVTMPSWGPTCFLPQFCSPYNVRFGLSRFVYSRIDIAEQ